MSINDCPDFSIPDPQRAEFEKKYKGLARPHFRGGDVTNCRPMTDIELRQYREYRKMQGRPLSGDDSGEVPF